jgi:beta-glucosidase
MEQLPEFKNYDMAGRTYRFMDDEPMYRFGFGMSYTRFEYENLAVAGELIPGAVNETGPSVSVSLDVRNAGERDGDEVVQLYLCDVEASVPVPRHHLEGIQRIHLRAGESTRVAFALTSRQFACFDDDGSPFVEAGDFRISVGGGQPDDPSSGAVEAVFGV